MRAAVKKLWVDALRSGDYEQGKGSLHYKGLGYCCLGVLADVAVKAGAIPPPTGEFDQMYDGSSADLGPNVMAWAGLDESNPIIDPVPVTLPDCPARRVDAWFANDALDWDFNRIADAIEANIPADDEAA